MTADLFDRVASAVQRDPGLWLLCAAVGAWMLFRWSRRRWRVIRGRKRRREFDERELRRWEGHRRTGDDVTRLRGK